MRLPGTQHRTLINGRTGSGKTTGAVWLLSQANFDEMPWIVLNHKNTKIIDAIPYAKHVDLNFRPTEPGIYIYHPLPEVDDDAVDALLWDVWRRGHIGVYIDEAYMINPRSPALNALYTQGREKHIPMLTLSQRPSRISRFAISESDFFMSFHIVHKKDRQLIQEFIPVDLEPLMHSPPGKPLLLPAFHSLYHDVGRNAAVIMRPVPDDAQLLAIFERRLAPPEPENDDFAALARPVVFFPQ